MVSWQDMALKSDPDHAPMNADVESNLRRVTPMLIRQPDDEVSIPSPFWHCSIFVESHSVALQHISYSIVTALLTIALEQRVQNQALSSLHCSLQFCQKMNV